MLIAEPTPKKYNFIDMLMILYLNVIDNYSMYVSTNI